MANIVLPITLTLTIARTIFVADAINAIRGGPSIVARAARAANSTISSEQPGSSASQGKNSSNGPPTQQAAPRPSGAGSSKARSLHLKLLAMHVMAIICQGAGVFKYALPVTVNNCTHTHRVKVAFTLFYDVALVTFLLAKVDVTNGLRVLACWEKVVIWLSRAYAWVGLPVLAIFVSMTFPGGTSTTDEGTFCDNGFDGDTDFDRQAKGNAVGYGMNNTALIVQFVLLLVLFIKPLLVRLEGTQAGAAVYRKVVIRNVVCTVLVCTSYIITTAVMVSALLRETPENNTASHYADSAPLVNQLVTLCLTEIALPLGFLSCWKACLSVCCVDVEARAAGSPAMAMGQGDEAPRQHTNDDLTNPSNPRIVPQV